MKHNFFEILVLEPKKKNALTEEKFLKDLQEVVDTVVQEKGTFDAKFRKSIDKDHPERLLFVAAWETIEAHDEFDVKGIVPKLLKLMLGHLDLVAAQFMFMDSAKVDFDALVWRVDAFHVKDQEKALFQKEIDTTVGLAGAWYITKKMPPLPTVMPTDPVELQILEEGMKRAEDRLNSPTPNIWMSISTPDSGNTMKTFGEKVNSYIQEMQSGKYEKFVGSKN